MAARNTAHRQSRPVLLWQDECSRKTAQSSGADFGKSLRADVQQIASEFNVGGRELREELRALLIRPSVVEPRSPAPPWPQITSHVRAALSPGARSLNCRQSVRRSEPCRRRAFVHDACTGNSCTANPAAPAIDGFTR